MKKRTIIFSLAVTILSLTLGFIIWNEVITDQKVALRYEPVAFNTQAEPNINVEDIPDFFYSIGTRFAVIKKTDIDKARSINDFLPLKQTQKIEIYKSVKVIILDDSKQTDLRETGNTATLNAAQIKLLQSTKHSTNILIRADYQEKNKDTNELQDGYSTPYLTIVPEKQAVYVNGMDALINYLKENSKEKTTIVQKDKLQPGKLYFTVNKKGNIVNAKITATSGYPSIDKMMIDLITKAPGQWESANNYKGEKVDQELVFSFGIIGC